MTKCGACGSATEPVWQMIFYLKDEDSLHLDQVYSIHYYSKLHSTSNENDPFKEQGEPDFFGGLKPTNLYKD